MKNILTFLSIFLLTTSFAPTLLSMQNFKLFAGMILNHKKKIAVTGFIGSSGIGYFYTNSQNEPAVKIKPVECRFITEKSNALKVIRCKTKQENQNCGELFYAIRKDKNAWTKKGKPLSYAYIESIDVPEKYRRQQIATKMLQNLEDQCKSCGKVYELRLYSLSDPAPVQCYQKFGFKKQNENDKKLGGSMYKNLA